MNLLYRYQYSITDYRDDIPTKERYSVTIYYCPFVLKYESVPSEITKKANQSHAATCTIKSMHTQKVYTIVSRERRFGYACPYSLFNLRSPAVDQVILEQNDYGVGKGLTLLAVASSCLAVVMLWIGMRGFHM